MTVVLGPGKVSLYTQLAGLGSPVTLTVDAGISAIAAPEVDISKTISPVTIMERYRWLPSEVRANSQLHPRVVSQQTQRLFATNPPPLQPQPPGPA